MNVDSSLAKIICRCCLSKQSLCNIYSLRNKRSNSVSYIEMIKECICVNAAFKDCLPPWICNKCANKIYSFYRFRQKCLIVFDNLSNDVKDGTNIKQELMEEHSEPEVYDINEVVSVSDELFFDTAQEPDISDTKLIKNDNKLEFNKKLSVLEDNGVQYEIKIEQECELKDFVLSNLDEADSLKKNNDSIQDCDDTEDNNNDDEQARNESLFKEFKIILPQISDKQTTCPLCNKRCHRNKQLLDHVKFVHFGIKYYCDICKRYFHSEYRHINQHMQKKWKECDQCGDRFTHKAAYLSHIMKNHGKKGDYQCECGDSFENKVLYKKHIYMEHGQKHFLCHICNAGYTRKAKLKTHIQGHIEGRVMKIQIAKPKPTKTIKEMPILGSGTTCPVCNKKCKYRTRLTEHIKTAHLGEKYFCNICKKYYQSESRHKRINHTKPVWMECKTCHIKFKTKYQYCDHLSSVHGSELPKEYPHVCHCGMSFQLLVLLRKHKYKEHKEVDFICHFCSRGFYKQDRLKSHLQVHLKEKLFTCDECDKMFSSRECLRRHKQLHSVKNQNFICDYCGKSFLFKLYLKAHITSHDPKRKPHACAVCGKRFRRTDHRNNHQRLVHKLERPNIEHNL